jgi:hypothetical protein
VHFGAASEAPDKGAYPRGCALLVRTTPRARSRAVAAGRDGWEARGSAGDDARSADAHGALETWLTGRIEGSGAHAVLVSAGAGRIESAWSTLDAPRGDPAAFAVSWAELLDRVLLPAPGVVALAERQAAGPARFEPPAEPPAEPLGPARAAPAPRWDAWLALACLCALLAAWRMAARAPRAAPG